MNWPVVAFLVAAPILTAADWNRQLPRGFPPPSVPADNPITAEKVQIGRHLLRQADVSKREAVLRELRTVGYGKTQLKNPAGPYASENRRVQVINASDK